MKKKLLSLAAAGVMTVVFLTGCSDAFNSDSISKTAKKFGMTEEELAKFEKEEAEKKQKAAAQKPEEVAAQEPDDSNSGKITELHPSDEAEPRKAS